MNNISASILMFFTLVRAVMMIATVVYCFRRWKWSALGLVAYIFKGTLAVLTAAFLDILVPIERGMASQGRWEAVQFVIDTVALGALLLSVVSMGKLANKQSADRVGLL